MPLGRLSFPSGCSAQLLSSVPLQSSQSVPRQVYAWLCPCHRQGSAAWPRGPPLMGTWPQMQSDWGLIPPPFRYTLDGAGAHSASLSQGVTAISGCPLSTAEVTGESHWVSSSSPRTSLDFWRNHLLIIITAHLPQPGSLRCPFLPLSRPPCSPMVPDLQFPSALRFPLPGSEVEATGHAPQLSEEAGEMSGPQLPVLWVLAHPFAICWGGDRDSLPCLAG